jgi:hypothetical protein
MTKKHFKALALEIRESDQPAETKWFAARVIARVASQDNPHFDRERFLKACGFA